MRCATLCASSGVLSRSQHGELVARARRDHVALAHHARARRSPAACSRRSPTACSRPVVDAQAVGRAPARPASSPCPPMRRSPHAPRRRVRAVGQTRPACHDATGPGLCCVATTLARMRSKPRRFADLVLCGRRRPISAVASSPVPGARRHPPKLAQRSAVTRRAVCARPKPKCRRRGMPMPAATAALLAACPQPASMDSDSSANVSRARFAVGGAQRGEPAGRRPVPRRHVQRGHRH